MKQPLRINPLMETFKSSSTQRSPIQLSSTPSKPLQTKLSHLLSEAKNTHLVNDPSSSFRSPLLSPLSSSRSIMVAAGKPAPVSNEELAIMKASGMLEKKVMESVQVFDERGQLFSRDGFVRQAILKNQRSIKRYRDEIKQVDNVVTELGTMVEKLMEEKKGLVENKAKLLQKKTEHEDIEYIREGRYKELKKIKQKVYSQLCDSTDYNNNTLLSGKKYSHKIRNADIEEIGMMLSIYMVDKNDPDIHCLLERLFAANRLLNPE